MKPSLLLALAFFGSTVLAQEPFPEIGPHHRVWASVEEVLHPDGTWGWATNAVVQLEPDLHRWENGRWVETEAGLEIAGDVVVGRTTAHRVIWAANARSPGAVDLELPDGARLVSQVLGLAYYDAATGQSVLIAELQDSIAEVHPPDVVLYPDAFDDVQASLIYVSRRGMFEQMVVLEEAPPDPKAFGLNPDTTRLEVLTEFVDPPEAIRTARVLREEADPARRAWMVEPDLVDEQVDFGTMFIGEGQAFIPAGEPWRMEAVAAVPVAKRWQRTPEGRTVLFEAVEYASLSPLLVQLPPSTTDPFRLEQRRQFAGAQRHLPIHKSEFINPKSTGPTTRCGTLNWWAARPASRSPRASCGYATPC